MSGLADIGAGWAWIIGGLVLMAGELLAPGIFLIWLGLAGLATGLAVALLTPAWQTQILIFAIVAVGTVLIGRRWTRNPPPHLNQRGQNLVGRTFVLDGPILDGVGRLRQGDTSWRIIGPDLPPGARVIVAALDGTTLVVTEAGSR